MPHPEGSGRFATKEPAMSVEHAIRLPIARDFEHTLSVWARFGPSIPLPELLVKTWFAWLTDRVQDPFRSSLRAWTLERHFTVKIVPTGSVPVPPIELLRATGLGYEEERRLVEATHEILICARDGHDEPRLAFWTVLGAARALADAYSGVILDRDVPRLLPVESYTKALTPWLHSDDFIRVVSEKEPQGCVRLLARGMRRFQLPMLEIPGVPDALRESLTLVLNALSQVLIWRMRRRIRSHSSDLAVPVEFRLDLHHEALRRAEFNVDVLPGARKWTMMGLQYLRGTTEDGPVLRLVLPPSRNPGGGRGQARDWMMAMVVDLFGAPKEQVARQKEEGLLEEAHLKAVDQIPEVKQRYEKGLPRGHRLYVKRAFPTRQGVPEFLWVQVSGWFEGLLRGPLATVPRVRTDLTLGQTLQMQEEDIYDWVISMADGNEIGGLTDQVVRGRKVYRVL